MEVVLPEIDTVKSSQRSDEFIEDRTNQRSDDVDTVKSSQRSYEVINKVPFIDIGPTGHIVVITKDKYVYEWGLPFEYESLCEYIPHMKYPTFIPNLKLKSVYCGRTQTIGIGENNEVYCWLFQSYIREKHSDVDAVTQNQQRADSSKKIKSSKILADIPRRRIPLGDPGGHHGYDFYGPIDPDNAPRHMLVPGIKLKMITGDCSNLVGIGMNDEV